MKPPLIAISQRVDTSNSLGERRDALDQRWWNVFSHLNGLPLPLPNDYKLVKQLLSQQIVSGIVLSGGNSLVDLNGDAPERDETDQLCIEFAIKQKLPLLGVCRGMQSIQHYFSGEFLPVDGHVCAKQEIEFEKQKIWVNSYHNWACKEPPKELIVTGYAADGVIKAVKHKNHALTGIMWHPEREQQINQHDINLIKKSLYL